MVNILLILWLMIMVIIWLMMVITGWWCNFTILKNDGVRQWEG